MAGPIPVLRQIGYDRRMPDDVHPRYPDRRPNGTFLPGHRRYGGAKKGRAMPRNWTRMITRLLSRLERGYGRNGHKMHHLRA
jgi:hypothetical protein